MEEKKIKIDIKNRFTGKILFEYENFNNTVRDTVIEAVKSGANLRGANLRGADLGGANLRGADLGGANLGGADLGGADLGGANLRGADLGGANLRGANLGGANLRGANLGGANLGGANLGGANLRGANLRGANLRGVNLGVANLGDAKNIPYVPLACPSDGAFVGWKKVIDQEDERQYLVKLLIPEDARRSSSTGIKCRCDKAKVLAIYDIVDNMAEVKSVLSTNYVQTCYMVGEEVLPDSFDENRWEECSHGIHFFINKQDAINY